MESAGWTRELGAAREALCVTARRLTRTDDVDDLVQDTLARALVFRARYDPARPLLPWLRRILVNLHFDRLRRPRTEREVLSEEPAGPADGRFERGEEIDFLFDQLGEPGRTLLRRFHQGGESIEELARTYAMPTGTIKSHLHRARRQLAERFTLGPDATVLRRPQTP